MKTVRDEWRKDYRVIYEMLHETPRVSENDITRVIGCTAERRMKEAFGQQIIVGPHIRKKSYDNLKEYICFFNSENTVELFTEYCYDLDITYHAKMMGFSNFFVISSKRFSTDAEVIVEGYRSDYHISYAPDRSWQKALQVMREKMESFGPDNYDPKNLIKTHYNETIEWDKKDGLLYRYFKYSLRKPLSPAMREYHISKEKIDNWLKKLPESCTVLTAYYPDTLPAYDPYLFMIETDYEDFIIELFSELPASCTFFKVQEKLFVDVHLPGQFVRSTDLRTAVRRLQIPLLMNDLKKKGIIKSEASATFEYSWGKDL